MKSGHWLGTLPTGLLVIAGSAYTETRPSVPSPGIAASPVQSLSQPTITSQPFVRTTPPVSIKPPSTAGTQSKTVLAPDAAPVPRNEKGDLRGLRPATRTQKLAARQQSWASTGKESHSGPAYAAPTIKGGTITGDNGADPFDIPSLPYFTTASTDGFTDDYDNCPADGGGAPDVVYRYLADHNQFITVDLCGSSYDTKVSITYTWDEFGVYACNDDFCGLQSTVQSFFLYSGDEIFIIVDGFDGDFGDYEIIVTEEYGEDGDGPFVIPSMPYYVEYTTNDHFDDYDEACPDASASADVVFVYTPADYESVTIDLCGSSYDTKVFVYENEITPGSAFACNEDGPGEECPLFQSRLDCIDLIGGNTYYIVVDGWGNQSGDFTLDMYTCAPPCWTGCSAGATADLDLCPDPGPDQVNGGCSDGGYFQYIEPNEIVCGAVSWDASDSDVDWYGRYMFEGDSVMWCVTGNFPFYLAITHIIGDCESVEYLAGDYGWDCDTICLGVRIPADGFYAFAVEPDYVWGEWPCLYNPQYQAAFLVDPACQWGGCPLGSLSDPEECNETLADPVNGGCYSNPPVFTEIPDNQYVCGHLGRNEFSWDEDAYRRHMMPGEHVTFAVQGQCPVTVYIYDIGGGCEFPPVVDFAEGRPCDILVVEGTADVETDFIFVVFARPVGNLYTCETGNWEYAAIINAGSPCPEFTCSPGATIEPEGCEITPFQGFNAGCNSVPPTYANIAYDETVCGTCWYGTTGFSIWRDTDWHIATDLADGDSVVWCVTAEFTFDAFIIAVSPGCIFDSNSTIVYDTGYACDTIYLSTRKQPGQDLRFVLAPRFFSPWLWCEFGEWNWEAVLTKVDESCACDCAGDPECDSTTNIFDVTQVVNVAFRNAAAIADPNAACPWARTDVTCDSVTNIFDVAKFVDVAFRNADPASEFCAPCDLIGGPK